jgi:hypothetical protein
MHQELHARCKGHPHGIIMCVVHGRKCTCFKQFNISDFPFITNAIFSDPAILAHKHNNSVFTPVIPAALIFENICFVWEKAEKITHGTYFPFNYTFTFPVLIVQ